MRKLDALRRLKGGIEPFIKFSSGSVPFATRNNPKLFGYLWPTLFPYGVGMMENNEDRSNDSIGFRNIDMKTHVAHLLQSGPNCRFQTHLSFIFVMGNLIQRRQTSFNAKLAVKRSWFPRVEALLNQITESTQLIFQKSAAKLVQYVNYVAEHIPGSMTEIQNMCEEMFSIVNTDGLPHIFLTLNPTDTNNPIAQVLAHRGINLDKFFHDLKPGAENLERSSLMAHNPIAGAEFFHTSVTNLLEILLGTKRVNKKGVFGEVCIYYGVVEAQGRGSLFIY
ncbi:hypothetical protein K435DRAFT_654566 [Dendrothele bispora CBS 962.96]|uniref:Helitron helicase-like domain-containing protein n=1 Tax=Dendrothele bispora (strain CBS 962.96) TaxID=1314807 RepID=A0A4V6T5K9_DENBC|nr:hypothetical protein K435DRAFT_654566 [Dendrothele bispora CBS 962.96]